MLFNSFLFLGFFAIVYVVYWNVTGTARRYFLIASSTLFYAAWGLQSEGLWGLRWTAHFLGMMGLNYAFTRLLLAEQRPGRRRAYITTIVVIDILNLGIFKYFDFLRDQLVAVGVPLPENVERLNLFLPLAISFYTFQMIAYLVDVYRGDIQKDYGLSRFFLFKLFVPQLIAGPIMRASDFMEQMDRPVIDRRRMFDGLWRILGGLVKKVVFADPMGLILAPVFRDPQTYDGLSILLAGMCFSIQVYCDFSGYTDMARGTANLLGFDIPENFRAPYFARSARELWQRWHVTLATWLRDYIYIPLGGSRNGYYRTYVNLIITFTLGGFWHGADWTYVSWGAFWGVLLALERFLEDDCGFALTPRHNKALIVLKTAFMFFLFCLGALMFRSVAVHHADGREYSSGHIMAEVFSGLVLNWPDAARLDFLGAGGDLNLVAGVFGRSVLDLNRLGNIEPILISAAALVFFHVVQYRVGLFERWRKYDSVLLPVCTAIVCGLVMPATAVGSHQFIYFVF